MLIDTNNLMVSDMQETKPEVQIMGFSESQI